MSIELIERFHSLHIQYGRTCHTKKDKFVEANHELFNLAQAIGHMYFPSVQSKLNECRREIMRCLSGRLDKLDLTDAVMAPANLHRKMTWSDFQITPEVASDPSLTFRVVPASKVKELNRLLKQQVSMIMKVCGV